MAVKDWSTTAASNTGIISGMSLDGSVMTVNQTDNAFRDFAAQIASQLGKMGFEGADIASASTTNLANATGWSLDITGTTTITAFGTVDAGQVFILRFTGALTLTHNSTSLILPGAANITTAAGDVAIMKSEGSGNWRCVVYMPAAGYATKSSPVLTTPQINDTSSDHQYVFAVSELAADRTVTLPLLTGDDTFVFASHAQTLSNKTLTAVPSIALSGSIPNIDFTDTDTNADCRIQANSATGSLVISADVNNEVATSTITFQVDGSTVGTWASGGNLTVTGDVTAFSDERLKVNWSDMGDIIANLASVKAGTYTRIDTGSRQVGVSAQSLREVLPEAVSESDDGTLSVAYGNAALAACVHLAREIVKLRAEMEARS